jgi:hypothetical protein
MMSVGTRSAATACAAAQEHIGIRMIIFHGTWYGSVFERLFITYLSDATAASHMYRSKPAGNFYVFTGQVARQDGPLMDRFAFLKNLQAIKYRIFRKDRPLPSSRAEFRSGFECAKTVRQATMPAASELLTAAAYRMKYERVERKTGNAGHAHIDFQGAILPIHGTGSSFKVIGVITERLRCFQHVIPLNEMRIGRLQPVLESE